MSREPDITKHLLLLADPAGSRGASCPDDALLASYVEARLDSGEHSRLEEHLADCSFCLAQVGFLARAVDEPLPAIPRELLDAVTKPRAQPRRWRPRFAYATLAAAATLVLAASVVLRLNTGSSPTAPASPEAGPITQSRPGSGIARTVRNGTSMAALTILEPREGAELSGPEIDLSWKPVPQALQYRVTLVSLEGDLVWEGQTGETRLTIPTTSLQSGQRYFLWTEALLRGGGSIKSTPVGFRIGSG